MKSRLYFDADVNLPAFLQAKNLNPFISKDLELTSSDIQFVTLTGAVAYGFQAETLPKFCDVFLDAERAGKLTKNQLHIAEAARKLYRSFATLGIVALVDEATGFQDVRPKDALQQYLELLVRKELAVWAKKFPDEFYENIYKLHQWLTPDIGDPMLASHMQSVLTLQRLALANGWGWQKFMHMVDQVMKKKGDPLDLPFTGAETPNA